MLVTKRILTTTAYKSRDREGENESVSKRCARTANKGVDRRWISFGGGFEMGYTSRLEDASMLGKEVVGWMYVCRVQVRCSNPGYKGDS